MTVGAASKYCCEKRMKLTSLETNSELKCLGSEIKRKFFPSIVILASFKTFVTLLELHSVVANSNFWTSASSEKCPKEFAWCGSSEFMDFEGLLDISRDGLDTSKLCITASLNTSTSALTLKEDECANNMARAICEVAFAYFSPLLLHGVIFIRCQSSNTCANAQSAGNSSVQRRFKYFRVFFLLSYFEMLAIFLQRELVTLNKSMRWNISFS
jgi:hypothetical protein